MHDALPLLRTHQVRVTVDDGRNTVLVSDASLHVNAGEIVCLAGPSGAGKTLTLRAILGALPRGCTASGQIEWRGGDTSAFTATERRAWAVREVGYVPQTPTDLFTLRCTVGAQVRQVARRHLRYDRGDARTHAADLFASVGLQADLLNAYPHQLSGGELQRAAIARALACEPSFLIADEPLRNLDRGACADFYALLTRLRDERALSILLVTQDVAAAERLADRVVVMRCGNTAERVAPLTFARPALVARRSPRPASPQPRPAEPVLEAHGITVKQSRGTWWWRASAPVLVDATLRVHRGERVAIVGPPGAGKSTLARSLALLHRPSAGSVVVNTRDAWRASSSTLRALRTRVTLVGQHPGATFDRSLTAAELVGQPLAARGVTDKTWLRQETSRLMHEVGIDPGAGERRIGTFSGGEQQCLTIARALATSPDVLMLDEPFTFLDRASRERLIDLLMALSAPRRMALVVIANDSDAVRKLADEVYVMNRGALTTAASEGQFGPRAVARA